MGIPFRRIPVGRGFDLYVASTDKFKTTSLRLVLRRPLREEEHSLNAVIPFVLRRGTRLRPSSRDIARYMEKLYGAQFAADVDKTGETQHIELAASVADERFLPERIGLGRAIVSFLGEALLDPLLKDGVFRADFVAQEAEHLRRRIASTINNKPRYAVNRLREEMCKDEPYGLHKYGDPDVLKQVTAPELHAHYRRVLATSPVDMFVVGPVDADEVAELVREHVRLPRENIEPLPHVSVREPAEERTVVEEQPVQQAVLALGFRTGVRYPDDDYAALQVYNGILGAFPHSKLFINVRERAGLAYFASSQLDATKGLMVVVAGIAPQKYEQALGIIREQVEALAQGDVSASELEQTKKGLVNALLSGQDSPERIIRSRLLGIVNGRVRLVEEMIEQVRAVTVDDVRRVAQKVKADTVYFLRSPLAEGVR